MLGTTQLHSQDMASAVSRLVGEDTTPGRQIAVFIAIDKYEELPALSNPVLGAN